MYVQIMGYGDLTKINIPRGDSGGELDPHGADGNGACLLSRFGRAFFTLVARRRFDTEADAKVWDREPDRRTRVFDCIRRAEADPRVDGTCLYFIHRLVAREADRRY